MSVAVCHLNSSVSSVSLVSVMTVEMGDLSLSEQWRLLVGDGEER